MDTSILSQELAPLKAQIEQIQGKIETLEGQLRSVDTELESFSTDKQRFDALRDVCNALDRLDELEAAELFWEGVPDNVDIVGHVNRLRDRIVQFEDEIRGVQEKRDSLKSQINLHLDDLDMLHEEVRDAYAREERRQEEFVIEREISPLPFREIIMPWANNSETESRLRQALLIAILFCIVFGSTIPMINVPVPDRSEVVEIPKRLAKLVKKEPPKPEPIREQPKEEKKPEPEQEQSKDQKPQKEMAKKESKPASAEAQAARKKAESTGVLAFKGSFADLMDETPVAKLGAEARLTKDSPRASGQARAQRSLVAMQTQGSGSGGIATGSVSRNIGYGGGGNGDRIGGVGFARVESAMAGMAEEEGRPVSDGPGPARTDEEIQIVFDRYKALLYRIYNKELRKDPTLRGKLLLRITIEPEGSVSKCMVESTDLASPELVAMIVERVERFNFGPKDGVPKTTILYPIDFLPAG